MVDIYTTEHPSSRDEKLDIYHNAAVEQGILGQNMHSVNGTIALKEIVQVSEPSDNASEGEIV